MELIYSEKIVYNNKDKKLISELVYNPIPSGFRAQYWLIISSAKQEMINNLDIMKNKQKFPQIFHIQALLLLIYIVLFHRCLFLKRKKI